VRHYEELDERVRVVAAAHAGVVESHHLAASLGTGRYLGWIDSDDILEATALEECVAVLDERPEVGMVYTDHVNIDPIGRVMGLDQRCRIPYSPMRLLIDFMTFHFRLIRREAFVRAGGIDRTIAVAEDYDLCLRLSEVTEIVHLQKPLYRYRVHPHAISQETRLEQIRGSEEAVRRAIRRRGLEEHIDLNVELRATFALIPKTEVGARNLAASAAADRAAARYGPAAMGGHP
jgi:GT2 family glycosyltransferase